MRELCVATKQGQAVFGVQLRFKLPVWPCSLGLQDTCPGKCSPPSP